MKRTQMDTEDEFEESDAEENLSVETEAGRSSRLYEPLAT
jgi:hypothetical protein